MFKMPFLLKDIIHTYIHSYIHLIVIVTPDKSFPSDVLTKFMRISLVQDLLKIKKKKLSYK